MSDVEPMHVCAMKEETNVNETKIYLECHQCGIKFVSKQKLQRHLNWHAKVFACDICERLYQQKSRLMKHKKAHELGKLFKKSHKPRLWNCGVCKVVFKTCVLLKKHWEHVHPDTPKDELQRSLQVQTSRGAIRECCCEYCGMKFPFGSMLKRHLVSHTQEAMYRCEFCDRMFVYKKMLQRHRRTHTGERPFLCKQSQCDSSFSSLDALTRHEAKHEGSKWSCPYCDKLFLLKGDMRNHIRYRHTEKRIYKCMSCDITFTAVSSVKRHLLKFHNLEDPHIQSRISTDPSSEFTHVDVSIDLRPGYKSRFKIHPESRSRLMIRDVEISSARDGLSAVGGNFKDDNRCAYGDFVSVTSEKATNQCESVDTNVICTEENAVAADNTSCDEGQAVLQNAPASESADITIESVKTVVLLKDSLRTLEIFMCEVCQDVFYTRAEIDRHLETHRETQSAPQRDSHLLTPPGTQSAPQRDSHLLTPPGTQSAPQRDSHLLTPPGTQSAPQRDSHLLIPQGTQSAPQRDSHLLTPPGTQSVLYQCHFCEKGFINDEDYCEHLVTVELDKLFPCQHCELYFTSQEEFNTHQATHFEERYQCGVCDVLLNTEEELVQHHLLEHKLPDEQDVAMPTLSSCPVTSHSSYPVTSQSTKQGAEQSQDSTALAKETSCTSLDTHTVTQGNENEPIQCSESESSPLKSVTSDSDSVEKKDIIKASISDESNFEVQVSNPDSEMKSGANICAFCEEKCDNERELLDHIRSIHVHIKLVENSEHESGVEMFVGGDLHECVDEISRSHEIQLKAPSSSHIDDKECLRATDQNITEMEEHTELNNPMCRINLPQCKNVETMSDGSKCDEAAEEYEMQCDTQQTTKPHDTRSSLTCYVCNAQFGDESKLVIHLTEHTNNSEITSESVDTEGELSCPYCSVLFNTKRLLYKHSEKCQLMCGKEKPSIPKSTLNYLKQVKQKNDEKEAEKQERKSSGTLQCDQCARMCATWHALQTHVRLKHTDTQYPCERCARVFTTRIGLVSHTHKTHEGKISKTVCEICGKLVVGLPMSAHMYSAHTVKPKTTHQCSQCGELFEYRYQLRNHVDKIHLGVVKEKKNHELKFFCTTCDQGYPFLSQLRRHEEMHMGPNVKPYVCQYCSKAFARKRACMIHERVHTGNKPYACMYCDAAFAQREMLERHVVKHTGAVHRCDICEKEYPLKGDLKSHIRNVHKLHNERDMQFACRACGKRFWYKSSCARHEKNLHGLDVS